MFEENKKSIFLIVFTILFITFVYNFNLVLNFGTWILGLVRPFIYALILAYVLNPIVKLYQRILKGRRKLAILFTYITIVVFLVLGLNYLVPKLWSNIYALYNSIPRLKTGLTKWIIGLTKDPQISRFMTPEIIKVVREKALTLKLADYVELITRSVLNITVRTTFTAVTWVFGFLISIYVLILKDSMGAKAKEVAYKTIGRRKVDSFNNFFLTIHRMIGIYIGIKSIDSMIIGSIAFIGLTILGSPLAVLLSFIVFLTNMIPYFGPFLGMAVAGTVHLFYDPKLALFSVIFLFGLQQFDGWFLDPKLIGKKVGLPPLVVIFSVTVAGKLFGPVGMLLASPIAATLKIYLDKFLKKRKVKS